MNLVRLSRLQRIAEQLIQKQSNKLSLGRTCERVEAFIITREAKKAHDKYGYKSYGIHL